MKGLTYFIIAFISIITYWLGSNLIEENKNTVRKYVYYSGIIMCYGVMTNGVIFSLLYIDYITLNIL